MSILKRFTQYVWEIVEEINLQMDERERYREALEAIEAHYDATEGEDATEMWQIARDALTDKPVRKAA
jgi:hypothetical protein